MRQTNWATTLQGPYGALRSAAAAVAAAESRRRELLEHGHGLVLLGLVRLVPIRQFCLLLFDFVTPPLFSPPLLPLPLLQRVLEPTASGTHQGLLVDFDHPACFARRLVRLASLVPFPAFLDEALPSRGARVALFVPRFAGLASPLGGDGGAFGLPLRVAGVAVELEALDGRGAGLG